MRHWLAILTVAWSIAVSGREAAAQHLWWDLEGLRDATGLYGEITVLATHPHIYYCGANWHPGEPAGGYCGIQHHGPTERRTIFSIWDTDSKLHPSVIAADPKTIFNRFGGEGEGAHTHMLWDWKEREPFRFFVRKVPGRKSATIDCQYFVLDAKANRWIHVATITSPDGGHRSVATFGGGMNSFLENFAGTDKDVPKLALYRLWLGTSPETLRCLTRAGGDGTWGILNGAYFLAEGEPDRLADLYRRLEPRYGHAKAAAPGHKLAPIPERPLTPKLVETLKSLKPLRPASP